jgi:hypothetical protein
VCVRVTTSGSSSRPKQRRTSQGQREHSVRVRVRDPTDLREMGWDGVDRIDLALDRGQ